MSNLSTGESNHTNHKQTMKTEDKIEYLSDEMVEKLDAKMKELKGIGLSDIDLYIIRYALSITNKP